MAKESFHSEKDKIRDLLLAVEAVVRQSDLGDTINRALVSHACVRLAGFFEVSHRILAVDWISGKCCPEALRYIQRSMARQINLKSEECIKLWTSYSEEWGEMLREHPEMKAEGKWCTAIAGVYRIRDSQAHGGNESVGIARVLEWHKWMLEYFDYVRSEFVV